MLKCYDLVRMILVYNVHLRVDCQYYISRAASIVLKMLMIDFEEDMRA